MKNNSSLIALIVIVAGVLVAGMIYFKQETAKIAKTLEAERYNRLVAEEKVINSISKIKQLESDLKDNQDKIAKIQAVLKEEKNINKDLESQFERLTRAKAELEEKLKEVVSQPAPPVETSQTAPSQ